MKFVILCEGSDDLWFIAYYLHKSCGWNIDIDKDTWKKYKLPLKSHQEALYIINGDNRNSGIIISVGGQDRLKAKIDDILKINETFPQDPIDAVIIFRDCDDRNQEDIARSMNSWFGDTVNLNNNTVSVIRKEIDEIDVNISILPTVIPFDEQGAVETLLLKTIEDRDNDGSFVADHARRYIDEAKLHVTKYLFHNRLVTKAKLSAAIAITNPDHSTRLFGELMDGSDWEKSPQIQKHFEEILKLISKQS